MTRMAAPTRGESPPRPDASMSLLTNLMDNSLDEGYAEAAARRNGAEGSRWRPSWVLGAGLVVVGALLATAAAQVRDRAPASIEARTALAAEVNRRTEANDRLEADLDRVRAAVAVARRDTLALTGEGSRLATDLATLEAATGAAAVSGPALVVHLEDATEGEGAADGDPRTEGDAPDGRVTDRDLQTIVNELWAVGAEAVAVNDQRLTSLSAIRSAGEAILVDFRPLSPPYDVVGIGDADGMRTSFSEGFGGSYLQVLGNYGIDFTIRTRDERLPASAGLDVRYARAPGVDRDGSGSAR